MNELLMFVGWLVKMLVLIAFGGCLICFILGLVFVLKSEIKEIFGIEVFNGKKVR